MKKPKAPVAGHYIPVEFAERVSGEIRELGRSQELDDADIAFGNGFTAALIFLNTQKDEPFHGASAKEFFSNALDVDHEARETSRTIAEIFNDIDEVMASHGFKSAGVGVVM